MEINEQLYKLFLLVDSYLEHIDNKNPLVEDLSNTDHVLMDLIREEHREIKNMLDTSEED